MIIKIIDSFIKPDCICNNYRLQRVSLYGKTKEFSTRTNVQVIEKAEYLQYQRYKSKPYKYSNPKLTHKSQ